MSRWLALMSLGLGLVVFSSCTPPQPAANPIPPSREVYRTAAMRLTAIVVSSERDVDQWVGSRFTRGDAPDDADGGSAIPITADGYFLTADHVLASSDDRNVFVIYGRSGRLGATKARIVWRSASSDLAVLHAPIDTPDHYQWTPTNAWVPRATPVMHAGIATGFKSSSGKLITGIPPETPFSGPRRFKHDIPLEPGDSGGPVVDGRGMLVGVNSAVEFLVPLETAFFIESEANRPNVGKLMAMIARDRKKNASHRVSP
ncbi:serine protease [Haloferula chungangensis]|uniref:Serine protease n=1 Tax=Haloferula chungangensis TaxID=1048331 RepID=A0ABW2L9U0_9BACT